MEIRSKWPTIKILAYLITLRVAILELKLRRTRTLAPSTFKRTIMGHSEVKSCNRTLLIIVAIKDQHPPRTTIQHPMVGTGMLQN